MDNQETEMFKEKNPEEAVVQPQSPFADSPYETETAPQTQDALWQWDPISESEDQPTPKKASGGKFGKRILACILIAALVASGCGITAYSINRYWEAENSKTQAHINHLAQQITALKDKINSTGNSVSGTVALGDALTPGQVYAKNVQSVVLISCEVTARHAVMFIQVSIGFFGNGFGVFACDARH